MITTTGARRGHPHRGDRRGDRRRRSRPSGWRAPPASTPSDEAIGAEHTALVAALREVAAGHVKIVPDIQVGVEGGVLGGLGALLMRSLADGSPAADATLAAAPAVEAPSVEAPAVEAPAVATSVAGEVVSNGQAPQGATDA